jgi:hypothetical protein
MAGVKEFEDKLYEKYDLNPEKVLNESGPIELKPIPKEWYPNLISELLSAYGINNSNYIINKNEKQINVFFSTSEEAFEFEKTFMPSFMKFVNKYITNQNMNPKDFNRSLVLESKINDKTFQINY